MRTTVVQYYPRGDFSVVLSCVISEPVWECLPNWKRITCVTLLILPSLCAFLNLLYPWLTSLLFGIFVVVFFNRLKLL